MMMMICAVHLLFVVQLFRALSLFATWKLMVRWGLYVSTKIKNGFEPLKNIVRIVYFMSILMRWNFNIVQQSVPVLSWGKKKKKNRWCMSHQLDYHWRTANRCGQPARVATKLMIVWWNRVKHGELLKYISIHFYPWNLVAIDTL